MKINLATDSRIFCSNCSVEFPAPEIAGFTGGAGYGDTGLFGNQMASVVRLDDASFRVYLTRRLWFSDRTTRMDIGYIDTPAIAVWPDIKTNFTQLRLTGLPAGCSCSQPYVIRRDNRFELFFWVHGAGMIRYVKCVSGNGVDFRIINLNNPCLYHPCDQAIRTDSSSDGFLTVKDHLRQAKTAISNELKQKISNDATTVYFDADAGIYVMFSVLLLRSDMAPERRVDYDNAANWLRVVHRRTSCDGIEWSGPEIVLLPEAGERADLQFYVLQQLKQDDRLCGLAGYYPVHDQVMDLEPMVSRDGGCNWIRNQRPWRLRDRIPGCDWPVQMLFPGGMIEAGGWIWMVATAFNSQHNQGGKLEPREYRQESIVMRQRCDRWAGLINQSGHGEIITGPLQYEQFRLETEAHEKVEVSLLSPYGNELTVCGRVAADGAIVFLDGSDSIYTGEWVRMRLRFDTTVYNLKSVN